MNFAAKAGGRMAKSQDPVNGCEILHQLMGSLSDSVLSTCLNHPFGAGFRWPIHSMTSFKPPQTYVGCWEQPGCFARECPVKHCLNSKSEVQEVANGSVSNAQCQHRKNVVLTSVFSFSEWFVECTTECYSG